jgi:hypothetical protein
MAERNFVCFIYFSINWIFFPEEHDGTSLGILRVKPEVFFSRFFSSLLFTLSNESFFFSSRLMVKSIHENAERTKFDKGWRLERDEKT